MNIVTLQRVDGVSMNVNVDKIIYHIKNQIVLETGIIFSLNHTFEEVEALIKEAKK
ncbi:hypothetical protein AAXE64_27890 [Priestia megaterium]